MKIVLSLLVLLATPLAFAETHCSDAAGKVQYHRQGYELGVPPRDGDQIDKFEVLVDGKVVSTSIAYKGKDPEAGPITPEFSQITILRQEQYTKDFSALLSLSKTHPSLTGDGAALPEPRFVICREVVFMAP
jgi:hypothetical protein